MSEKVYNFKDSIKFGKYGEDIVINYIKNLKYDVIDVSNDKKYQNMDIDILLKTKDNTYIGVEVKTDSYDTGNIFFEIVSSTYPFNEGCMFKTRSDFIFYFFTKTKELYILNTSKYRKFVLDNISRFEFKKVKNKTYESLGCLVPKKAVEKNHEICRKVVLKDE